MSRSNAQGKSAVSTILFVVSMIGMAVGFNVISGRFFHRIDLTSEKVYTLSKSSKELVRDLPDRMNVKLFMSEDLPPDSKNQAQFARDLLSEYETYSTGKLHVEIIKMKSDEADKEKLAKDCKVQKLNRGERSKNKLEIASSYLGICFDYHGQIESIPAVERAEGLEYEISGLIKRMTVKKRKLAFASSEGELGPSQGLQIFSEQLRKAGYEVSTLELKAAIPEDVDGLLVVGPKQKFSDRAKYLLDQFLMKGKAVAIFVDGETFSVPKGATMPGIDLPQIAQPTETGLDDLLENYGIKLNHDIVFDRQNAVGPLSYGGQMIGANHPSFVAAGPLPQDHPITQGLEVVIFPNVSSLELVGDAKNGKSSAQFFMLAKSSKESWKPKNPIIFDPLLGKRPAPTDVEKGPFYLAYAGTGKFRSFFAGKQIVKEDGTKVEAGQSLADIPPMLTESKQDARLVVVAGSQVLTDQYIGLVQRGLQWYLANLAFGLNVVDWAAQDEGLAAVRKKGMQNHPLKEVSAATTNLIKVGNIVGVPLLVCLLGLFRWRWRQSRRNRMKFHQT